MTITGKGLRDALGRCPAWVGDWMFTVAMAAAYPAPATEIRAHPGWREEYPNNPWTLKLAPAK